MQQLFREVALALIVTAAAVLVVWGVADVSAPAAKVVAGLALVGLGWLFLVEAD